MKKEMVPLHSPRLLHLDFLEELQGAAGHLLTSVQTGPGIMSLVPVIHYYHLQEVSVNQQL